MTVEGQFEIILFFFQVGLDLISRVISFIHVQQRHFLILKIFVLAIMTCQKNYFPEFFFVVNKLRRNFHDGIPINHIPAAGNNMAVRINAVVLQLLMLSCITIMYEQPGIYPLCEH